MSHPPSFFERRVTIFTQDQMFERLHGRVMTAAAQTELVPSIARLVWHKVDAFTLHSECGLYAIYKTRVHGQIGYSAGCRMGLKGMISTHLKSAAEARKITQAYADSLTRNAKSAPR